MKNYYILIALLFTIPATMAQDAEPLRELAKKHEIEIGAAVGPQQIQNDALYRETLAREFSMVTTENALKFRPTEPQQGRFTFDDADTIIEFAESNNMKVRGHTLVWHSYLPNWVENNDWTREEAIEVLRNHIETVVSRYEGRIFVWDVVNEAFENDGSLRDDSAWYEAIGPEYVEMAFRWAHEADPDAVLFYNDFGAEEMNAKSKAIYEMAKDFKERGVPIDGIGLQMHIPFDHHLSGRSIRRNIQQINDLGLQVHITELDVRIDTPVTDEELQEQADVYEEMLKIALEAPNCTAFITWGFTDRYSWIPSFFEGTGAALLFDEDYNPKPAYQALNAVLQTPPAQINRWKERNQ